LGGLRIIEVLLLELVNADALLAVGFGFCGAVGIDGLFGEEVGAAAGDDEGGPAVAIVLLALHTFFAAGVAELIEYERMYSSRIGLYEHGGRQMVDWVGV
jgi:hypothetical protein